MRSNQYKLVALLSFLPIAVSADVTGADPRLTAAPGDNQAACTACHTGTRINGGGGSVKILLPGGPAYTPGVKQHIQVQVTDSAQRRWGFELSARLDSDPGNGQAGDLTSTDGNSQVMCVNNRPKPCSSASVLQFITHTLSGTRPGTTNSAVFDFDWTPPDADLGNVTLYAAGNAANGNTQETGDHIYTTSINLAVAAVSPTPVISSDTGVLNAASLQPSIAQNSWITILGQNLSSTTRTWNSDDLAAGQLPSSLDSVSVTVNGKPAYVEYISPTQLNVLTPSDDALGPVSVQVTSSGQTSAQVTVNLQSFAPAFFTFDGKYVATTPGDNSMLDKSGLFFSANTLPAPVKPGDVINLYGTGLGPTDSAANLATPFTILIGGAPATVSFSGLASGMPQIYQFTVQVPDGLSDGDQPVVVQMGGASSPSDARCCYLAIQN